MVAGVVISLIVSSHHTALAGPNPGHATGHPASSHGSLHRAQSPAARRAHRHPLPRRHRPRHQHRDPGPSRSGLLGPAVIPAGYHKFVNSTGFSIAMPNGWRISTRATTCTFCHPQGPSSCSSTRATIPSPTRSGTGSSRKPTGKVPMPATTGSAWRRSAIRRRKSADWEFTYYHQGVLTHVLNRNILANSHHAYALYWSTPDSQWGQDWRHLQDPRAHLPACGAIGKIAARARHPEGPRGRWKGPGRLGSGLSSLSLLPLMR